MTIVDNATETAQSALRRRVDGTSISSATLMSADYFNLFNEIIMALSIVPDLIDDLERWTFRTYPEHFQASGLPFASLAIEAYALAPAAVRTEFEGTVAIMRELVEDARTDILAAVAAGRAEEAAAKAGEYASELQAMVSLGATVVNGRQSSMDQSAIDGLF